MKNNSIFTVINDVASIKLRKRRLKLVFYSLITGIITGIIVVAYRILLDKIVIFRNSMLDDFILLAPAFVLSVIIIQKMLDSRPLISGSGIPQVMGLLKEKTQFSNFFIELVYKFFGGILAIFTGLSLGREGPSIHIGSLVADGVSKISKSSEIEKRYIITAGSSAGLSAAFNAPLAGTIFALEELHKFFSPLLLICSILASIAANFMSEIILGKSVAFDNFTFVFKHNTSAFSVLLDIFLLFMLSIVMVLAGKLFITSLLKFQKIYRSIKINRYIKVSVISLISLIFVYKMPDITGGGHHLIDELLKINFTTKAVLILLVFKFVFTMLSYSTGFPGGIFLPMLVIGALIGRVYGIIAVNIFDLDPMYITQYMLLGMAAYFVVIVKAPITGIVLILEMTGNFSNLFSLTIIAAFSYILSEFAGVDSVYEHLYHNMFGKNSEYTNKYGEDMTAIKIPVLTGSNIEGKLIKDLNIPENVIIIGIERDNFEFILKGKTKILSGDKLIIFTNKKTAILNIENIFEGK